MRKYAESHTTGRLAASVVLPALLLFISPSAEAAGKLFQHLQKALEQAANISNQNDNWESSASEETETVRPATEMVEQVKDSDYFECHTEPKNRGTASITKSYLGEFCALSAELRNADGPFSAYDQETGESSPLQGFRLTTAIKSEYDSARARGPYKSGVYAFRRHIPGIRIEPDETYRIDFVSTKYVADKSDAITVWSITRKFCAADSSNTLGRDSPVREALVSIYGDPSAEAGAAARVATLEKKRDQNIAKAKKSLYNDPAFSNRAYTHLLDQEIATLTFVLNGEIENVKALGNQIVQISWSFENEESLVIDHFPHECDGKGAFEMILSNPKLAENAIAIAKENRSKMDAEQTRSAPVPKF